MFYKFESEKPFEIEKEDDSTWHIKGEKIEKLFKMTKIESEEGMNRFLKKLRRLGVDDKLKELGVKENDQVRILDFYFDFKD